MKTGFIYIWRNTGTKKFYIGSHIGTIDDGYVGSGVYFKRAYKKAPHLFKRRIIEFIEGDVNYIVERENYWLQLASKCPSKYYNQIFTSKGLHPYDYDALTAMKLSKLGRKWFTNGQDDWLLYEQDGYARGLTLGRTKQPYISHSNTGRMWITNGLDEVTILKDGVIPCGWRCGRSDSAVAKTRMKTMSQQSKDKLRVANTGSIKSEQAKQKMSDSKKGRKWYRCEDKTTLSYQHPGPGWVEGR